MKYQDIPGAKKQHQGHYFKMLWCSNHGRIYLLQNWGMLTFEFIQVHLDCQHGWHGFDRTPKKTVFSANSMSSRHLKTTMLIKSMEEIEWPQFSKTFDFWGAKKFSQRFFSPSFRLFSALRLPPRVRGSRGMTPLHYAAREGHDAVVARLLEAKAAVDVQNKDSRGLGGGFGGKPLEAWDSVVKGSEMKMLMVQIFWWILFSQLIGKFAKTFAPMFGVVLCEHNYIVPTLRVGVSLNQGFQSGNRVACPSQSKLFLRFRSVHSDTINHCLTGSLFADLINRTNLRFSSSYTSYCRPLTRLHEIPIL